MYKQKSVGEWNGLFGPFSMNYLKKIPASVDTGLYK